MPAAKVDPSSGMLSLYLEDLGCIAILAFFAMQGAIPFIAPNQALESSRSAATGLTLYGGIVSQILAYGGIVVLVLSNLRRIARYVGAMQWTAALAVLAIGSAAWSQFPLLSLRRSLLFTLAGFFGLYLAVRFPLRRQLSILGVAMSVLALASIVLAVCSPKLGLDASAGHHQNWQGVFTQKNACGRAMVLASAVVLADWRISLPKFAGFLLFVFVLFMSGSRSAWAAEAAILALFAWLAVAKRIDRRGRIIFDALTVFLGAVFVGGVLYLLPVLLPVIGRDPTLSGRTEIWNQVWRYIQQRPVLGWGYSAFWHGIEGESFNVAAALRFVVFHAHNGFLEIWLELGLPGLALFALSYLRAWRKLLPVLRSSSVSRGTWMTSVLVLIFLYSLDENTLLTFNGMFWVLYVSAAANIELLGAEDRLSAMIRRVTGSSSSHRAAGEPEWLS